MNPMPARRRKILFFAEGATLAHVARPFLLANSLDAGRFDITFARPAAFSWLTADAAFPVANLPCLDATAFARKLEHGAPLYDYTILRDYVATDLDLIDTAKPDVIVGDFRLSLSVSARLRGIPYITICDAYWSPEQPLNPPLPVLAFTPYVPIPLAQGLFRWIAPLAMRRHAAPLERLRAEHGLTSLDHDLRRCYTDADLRLLANFPDLYPEVKPSPHAAFIGPIAWSPEYRGGLDFLAEGAPYIYVTMGSSGDPRVLSTLIPVLERTGMNVLVASAGKPLRTDRFSSATRVFDYLPGDLLCRHAHWVVCNGGSPTTNQALANGVPVLGIARNMDQFLNMRAIESSGAGLVLRADRVNEARLRQVITRLLGDASFARRADLLARDTSPTLTLTQAIDGLTSA
jgi:UDP:flavonoid glycosyltransferase YjiC (YdhE family)